MKKMHILLMGAVMVMATPAMADDDRTLPHQNDNNQTTLSEPAASSRAVSYDDYSANDDDHGDEHEQTEQAAHLGFTSKPTPRDRH